MTTPSDTPRTDAAEMKIQLGFKETSTGQVPIAECRKIERDLMECQDAGKHYRITIDRQKRALESLSAQLAERERELAEARKERDALLGIITNAATDRGGRVMDYIQSRSGSMIFVRPVTDSARKP